MTHPPTSDSSPLPPATSEKQAAILFTAFEPSGDDHAAAVIAELKRQHPDLRIFAWGGPKMRRAGAQIIAETGDKSVMGLPGIKTIREHFRIRKQIAEWIEDRPEVKLLVPVDSPGHNFAISKIAKRAGLKVAHLAAPQLWAWGQWRVGKLRRCTDMVMCVLPFEEQFFHDRNIPARFIGHPLFDEPLDLEGLEVQARERLPQGTPKVAILPGSRANEIRRNFPLMLSAFREIKRRHPEASGVVAATTESVRESLYANANTLGGWPDGLDVVVGETDLAIRWADVAIVVSGTVTLQLAKQTLPMVILYKVSKIKYKLIGQFLIRAPHFTLPNLVAGREIVPELIPYFGGSQRLTRAALKLVKDTTDQEAMRTALRSVTEQFAGKQASSEAANVIAELLGLDDTTEGLRLRHVG
ncbi:MAG: lipid-A-disaccharide synthase [Planctomycetota bacterium]